MKMKNLKKQMLKAGVTLGLVFGAALFAVSVTGVWKASAASIADYTDKAWSNSGTSYPEPTPNADGSASFNPFDASTISTPSMNGISSTLIKGDGFGLGVDMAKSASEITLYPKTFSSTNTLDLSKPFKQQSNVYFGDSSAAGNSAGMSFVLSADPNAFQLDKQNFHPFAGSGIGVWGTIVTGSQSGSTTPNNTAIQNSFVIAMDTHADQNFTDPSTFNANMDDDVNYSGSSSKQYVGYGYPGLPSMYKADTLADQKYTLNFSNSSNSGYANGGNYDLVTGSLTNGGWHQLTVSWAPDGSGGGKLTY